MSHRRSWPRSRTLAAAGLATFALCGCVRHSEQDVEPPANVILISLDTLRADRLGVYGHTGGLSSAIDAFAQEAVLFERHFVAAPTTLASHTSLMTGNHPHTHGVPGNGSLVHRDNVMLAEVLGEAGYRTAGFLGASPLSSRTGFEQGFDVYDEVTGLNPDGTERRARPGAWVNDAFFKWYDGSEAAPLPMFVFLHYFDVHSPYIPPPSLRATEVWMRIPGAGSHEHIRATRRLLSEGDPAAARMHSEALEVLYEEGVQYIDYVMEHLFAGLRERGLLKNSIVILTADHGEAFAVHDEYWNHGFTVYDATAHTPLIIRLPGGVAGRRESRVLSNIDVFPTVLEQLGLAARTAEGQSFAPLLRGESMPARAPVFIEATKPWNSEGLRWSNDPCQRGVRTARHKFIHDPDGDERELYDLADDPGELVNRVGEPDLQVLGEDLAERLQRWHESASPLPTVDVEEAQLEALRSLGYVEE